MVQTHYSCVTHVYAHFQFEKKHMILILLLLLTDIVYLQGYM